MPALYYDPVQIKNEETIDQLIILPVSLNSLFYVITSLFMGSEPKGSNFVFSNFDNVKVILLIQKHLILCIIHSIIMHISSF